MSIGTNVPVIVWKTRTIRTSIAIRRPCGE